MSIFISEDFNGDYTPQGIEEATWTELTETEDGQWWTPVETQNPAKECWGDLSGYVEKEFVLAFRYKTPPGLTEGVQHPTVTINPISLDKTLDGQVLSKSNPKQDLGFQHVVVAGDAGNPRLDASAIGFQPSQTPLQTNVEIWCISGRQKPNEVAPDSGEPIRSLSMPIKSYTYTFSQPGTYTVTFEAHNANAWNAKEALCEFEIDVKHR